MKDFISYLTISLVVLLSGSLYVSIFQQKMMIILFIISLCLVFLFRTKFNRRNINHILIISLILLIQTFFTLENGVNLKDIFHIIFSLIILILIQSSIEKEEFINKFVNIVFVICIISLICYFSQVILGISRFPLQISIIKGRFIYDLTPYYTIGYTVINSDYSSKTDAIRNSGLFWEPGAFQCLINLALLFITLNKSSSYNGKKMSYIIKLVTLVLTLLTTQSTTGYIVFLLIICYLLLFTNAKNIKHKTIKTISVLICLSFIFTSAFTTDVIYKKVFLKQGSYSTRNLDTIVAYRMFWDKPSLGYGYNAELYRKVQHSYGVSQNSNGIGITFAMLGIFFTSIYLFMLFNGIKNFYNIDIIKTVYIFCIFLTMLSTEWFTFKLVFLTFLFNWKSNKTFALVNNLNSVRGV